MTASPTPNGADRASLIERSTASILEAVGQNEGISANGLSAKVGINYTLCHNICRSLVDEGRLIRTGKGKQHRYYLPDYDRTTPKKEDNTPIVVKRKKQKKTAKVAKEVADAVRSPGPSVPADLKAFTPLETAPGIPAEIPAAPVAGGHRVSKRMKVEFAPSPQSDIGKALAEIPEEIPAEIPEEIPAETAPAETGTVHEAIDVDALFAQLDSLRAIPRGGPLDAQLDTMVAEAEDRIRSSLLPCPHCGGDNKKLRTSADGKHSIQCSCGAMFAYTKDPTSLKCTIKAYNKRV